MRWRNSSVLARNSASVRRLHLRLERVDALDPRPQTLDLALVSGAEYFGENRV